MGVGGGGVGVAGWMGGWLGEEGQEGQEGGQYVMILLPLPLPLPCPWPPALPPPAPACCAATAAAAAAVLLLTASPLRLPPPLPPPSPGLGRMPWMPSWTCGSTTCPTTCASPSTRVGGWGRLGLACGGMSGKEGSGSARGLWRGAGRRGQPGPGLGGGLGALPVGLGRRGAVAVERFTCQTPCPNPPPVPSPPHPPPDPTAHLPHPNPRCPPSPTSADVRCGHWFSVRAKGGRVTLEQRPDLLQRAEPRICAFDIGEGLGFRVS